MNNTFINTKNCIEAFPPPKKGAPNAEAMGWLDPKKI